MKRNKKQTECHHIGRMLEDEYSKKEGIRPTEILKKEHEIIKQMLSTINKITNKIEKKESVDENDLKSIVEFIREFADKCHHAKEEDKLFPAMEEYGIPREGGPIGVMIEEHELGRSYVKNMSIGLEKKDLSKFIENAKNYAQLLDQHIDKENNILYMMADMHIPQAKQNELLREFEKTEKSVGKEKHEKFHRLVKELTKKYR